jgi:hypothetical protein
MDEWKIQRDRQGCQQPGCPLPSSRQDYAVLEFPECVRRELCDACFVDRQGQAERGQLPLVFWRALRKQSGSKEATLDLMSLRALFDRLGEVDDERARALRYFSALLLLRKRVLKMIRPRTKEQERADLVLIDPKVKDMEPVLLFAPPIDLDDLGSIKDDLLAAIGEGEGDGDGDGDGDAAPSGKSAVTDQDADTSTTSS